MAGWSMFFLVMMSDILTSLTCIGPSSFGYSFLAAFFLSFAAFSAFSASSFNLACISSYVSALMKVSMTQFFLSPSSFPSASMFFNDSIWFLDCSSTILSFYLSSSSSDSIGTISAICFQQLMFYPSRYFAILS
jgi:hypothetical protein